MAEKWERNADATEFTFTIKKDLIFSNGDPVLPSSFKYAWVRNGQADFASPYGYLIELRQGRRRPAGGHRRPTSTTPSWPTTTAMTLKVTLEAPQADFPAIVSHPFFGPLPEKVVSQLTDQTEWDKGIMIGNGPFKMEAPANDQEVVLVRNDDWAGNVMGNTKAKLDKLIFKISQDQSSRPTPTSRPATLDTATIPSGQYADATAKYGNTVESPQLGSYYFDFGSTDPQLGGEENLKLRQAISLAIDRERDQPEGLRGRPRRLPPASRPPASPASRPDLCKYCTYDLDAAKTLLSTSGRPTAAR